MAQMSGNPGLAVCQEHAARLVCRSSDSLSPRQSQDPQLSHCVWKRAVLKHHVLRLGG